MEVGVEMIPRLMCFLFGHRRRTKVFVGVGPPDEWGIQSWLFDWKWETMCSRCGKRLEPPERKER